MVKVLYLPIGKQDATERAFRAVGAEVSSFDYFSFTGQGRKNKSAANQKVVDLVKKLNPDLLHMQLQLTDVISPTTLETVRKICPDIKITNWSGDIRRSVCKPFIAISKVIDFSLLSNIGQIDMYRRAGCTNATYWQIGYDREKNFPKKLNKFKYDVVFTGNIYSLIFPDAKLREEIANALKSTFGDRAGIFGSGYKFPTTSWPMDRLNDLYNDSLCVVSVSNFNDVAHYFSDRLLYCVASGRPTIAFRFPGISSYFSDGGDILVARNKDDVVRLVRMCQANPELAYDIGRNGAMKARAEHTFESRIMELMHLVGLADKL
jgi:glycosyltransferase involved in cell wall biosynthesis